MNILYVYAHPNPKSLNAALMQTALSTLRESGCEVKVSDLYAQNFKSIADNRDFTHTDNIDPQYFNAQYQAYENHQLTTDITNELEKIAWADHIIFQFPLWWFSAPAILKGWFDRVFIKGFAYDAEHMFANGLLKDKTASFVVTTQSPEAAYQANGAHKHTLKDFLLPLTHTLNFAGIQSTSPFVVYGANQLDNTTAETKMNELKTHLHGLIKNAA